VRFEVQPEGEGRFTLALRLPDWCPEASLHVNGVEVKLEGAVLQDGYIRLARQWCAGDVVELKLAMPVTRMYSHPLVRGNAGKVALQRGPLVYCLEQADNGANLHELVLPRKAELHAAYEADLLGGIVTVQTEAVRITGSDWDGGLYSASPRLAEQPATLKFIPYYAWANRGEGEMMVWVRER